MNNRFIKENILFTALLFIGLLSSSGSLVYYFYRLNYLGIILSLVMAFFACFLIIRFFSAKYQAKKLLLDDSGNIQKKIGVILFFALLGGFYVLLRARTSESIISPWQVVDPIFFLLYFLSSLFLLSAQRLPGGMFFYCLYYFLAFSICAFVYKVGYGFDPFIHRAALSVIDIKGFVDPKTIYYLGQYSLEIIFHKIIFLPVGYLDKFLVPGLAAIFLPWAIGESSGHELSKFSNRAMVLLLAIPFSIFIVTVPQNLAYLFLLLIVFLNIKPPDNSRLVLSVVLALAAFFTQPVAGVPAVLFVCLIAVSQLKTRLKTKILFFAILYILMLIFFPIAFYILENNNFDFVSIFHIFSFSTLSMPQISMPIRGNFWYNFIYLYGNNILLIILFIVFAGIVSVRRELENFKYYYLYFVSAIIMAFSYWFAKNLSFNYLISYEQGDYLKRLLVVALIFSAPFALFFLRRLVIVISSMNFFIRISWAIFGAILICASLYVSYPRLDVYANSRGYSTSRYDLEAVSWISLDAVNKNYIVLANQQVSAAALEEAGFAKYYPGNIFYYSIPAGGPMYKLYLKYLNKPAIDIINEAKEYTGAEVVYVVVNKYWDLSQKIISEAKISANSWQEIGSGNLIVFKY
jgi:hypothetical protein